MSTCVWFFAEVLKTIQSATREICDFVEVENFTSPERNDYVPEDDDDNYSHYYSRRCHSLDSAISVGYDNDELVVGLGTRRTTRWQWRW